jgi:hypothetical protein
MTIVIKMTHSRPDKNNGLNYIMIVVVDVAPYVPIRQSPIKNCWYSCFLTKYVVLEIFGPFRILTELPEFIFRIIIVIIIGR